VGYVHGARWAQAQDKEKKRKYGGVVLTLVIASSREGPSPPSIAGDCFYWSGGDGFRATTAGKRDW